MKTFKIYTDERVIHWQRVGVLVEAETAEEALLLLKAGPVSFEYSGDVATLHDTEQRIAWDHRFAEIETETVT